MNLRRCFVVIILNSLFGCAAPYTLIAPGATRVADDALLVTPTSTWNRIPETSDDLDWEESWTKNGPLLDTVAFVAGLPDGEALARQKKNDDQQVPSFRASMTPEDLVSMIEASYRSRGVPIFNVIAVEPQPFLGATGIQLDYSYVLADKLPRKGRCIMNVKDKKLYLMKLEGAASHYFDAALPEFAAMSASAAIL